MVSLYLHALWDIGGQRELPLLHMCRIPGSQHTPVHRCMQRDTMLLIAKWKPISQCKRTPKKLKIKWKLTSKGAAETLHSIAKFPKTQKSWPGCLLWFSICGYIQGDPKLYWEKPTTAYQVNWPWGFVFWKEAIVLLWSWCLGKSLQPMFKKTFYQRSGKVSKVVHFTNKV